MYIFHLYYIQSYTIYIVYEGIYIQAEHIHVAI